MLELSKNFFSALNEQGVRYCHWKSNEHLDAALEGKTDIDLLVHPDDRARFEDAMAEHDIKEIISPAEKRFPGLEDYLGFDRATGKFLHLHIHYKMVMGQKYIKNHHLPLEDVFFSNLTQRDGVYVPVPELELILLIIRAHIKTDYMSLIKHAIKGFTDSTYTAFPHDIENEFKQLIANSDMDKVRELAASLEVELPISEFFVFINRFTERRLRFYHIFFLQLSVLERLRPYRRAKSILIYFSYFGFFLDSLSWVSRFKGAKKKTLPHEGRVVAIVGADGSGKSTLTAELTKWLSWKLSVENLYYGIPKGRTSKLYSFLSRVLNKLSFKRLNRRLEAVFWLYVAKNRAKVSFRSAARKMAGGIALTDRFPLRQFETMPDPMDGRRLIGRSEGIESLFSDRERTCYETLYYPDLVIALNVDIDTLRTRKKDLPPLNEHKVKAEAINALDKSVRNLSVIDATQPYEKVVLEAKTLIWELL